MQMPISVYKPSAALNGQLYLLTAFGPGQAPWLAFKRADRWFLWTEQDIELIPLDEAHIAISMDDIQTVFEDV